MLTLFVRFVFAGISVNHTRCLLGSDRSIAKCGLQGGRHYVRLRMPGRETDLRHLLSNIDKLLLVENVSLK